MKKILSVVLCAFMLFTCAALPVYADSTLKFDPGYTTFTSDGEEFIVRTYSSEQRARNSGGAEKTMGIEVLTPTGQTVYNVSCTFVFHYDSATNYVKVVSLRTNVHEDSGYGFTHSAISYMVGIGVEEVKLTVCDRYGVEKDSRIMRCYSDGHTEG